MAAAHCGPLSLVKCLTVWTRTFPACSSPFREKTRLICIVLRTPFLWFSTGLPANCPGNHLADQYAQHGCNGDCDQGSHQFSNCSSRDENPDEDTLKLPKKNLHWADTLTFFYLIRALSREALCCLLRR